MKIKKHDFVLIDDGLRYRLHKIVDMKIKIKKCNINLLFLVNKKYGSTFTYINNKWIRSKKKNSKLDIDYNVDIKGNNKDIYDNNNSQRLTDENIAELKEMNYEDPYEIVQKLIENSSTFKDKTIISKFKYVEKKLKRHLCQFTVYECNILNLAKFYYKYFPEKISNVRMDYLANILFHLNKNFYQKENIYDGKKKVLLQTEKSSQLSHGLNGNKEDNCYFKEDSQDNDLYSKQNILIYDDSYGLLTGVLNIYYNYNVNIFSLVHKNSSNSIIPSFGIKKNMNTVRINILNSKVNPQSSNYIYINSNCDFVFNFKYNLNSEEKHINQIESCFEIINEDNQLNENDKLVKEEKEESEESQQISNSQNIYCVEEKKEKKNNENEASIKNDESETKNNINNNKSNSDECISEFDPNNYDGEIFYKHDEKKRKKNILFNDNNNKKKKIINYEKNENENDINIKNEVLEDDIIIKRNLLNDICQRKADSFVIILSSKFLYETKTDVNLLLEILINISLRYLKNDSKIIIHTDDLNISNMFMQYLMNTNSFINIKLNEYILREQQVIKRRTHPIMKNSKLADGFLLTALKVQI